MSKGRAPLRNNYFISYVFGTHFSQNFNLTRRQNQQLTALSGKPGRQSEIQLHIERPLTSNSQERNSACYSPFQNDHYPSRQA